MKKSRILENVHTSAKGLYDAGFLDVATMSEFERLNTMPVKVYTASCTTHASLWRDLTKTWPEIEFTARWPHSALLGGPLANCPAHASVFWDHDFEDVKRSDVIMVYGAHDNTQHLCGALVEAGWGIAFNKIVVVVGEHVSYGTWQHHRQVKKVRNLNDARSLLHLMTQPTGRLAD